MAEAKTPDQTRLALAALAACVVQTLAESDPSFPKRFERHLEKAYAVVREGPAANVGAMETLKWVGEFLKEMK